MNSNLSPDGLSKALHAAFTEYDGAVDREAAAFEKVIEAKDVLAVATDAAGDHQSIADPHRQLLKKANAEHRAAQLATKRARIKLDGELCQLRIYEAMARKQATV